VTALLILTAVEVEARALAARLDLPRLASFPFLAFGGGSIRLAPVGLAAARCGARWAALLDGLEHPLIISAGVCGALDPGLQPGDLVIPAYVVGPSGERHRVAPTHHRAAAHANPTAWLGDLVTVTGAVLTPEAKASLRASSGAVAVDMESSLIMSRAAQSDCPALVIRGVSDSAEVSLPAELVGLVTPEGRVRLSRAVALTVARPRVLPRAFMLRHRTQSALRAVARAVARLAA
jgi:adenosylhomocysteine nucleosidase